MTTIECQLTVESQNVTHVHSQLNFAENVTRDFFFRTTFQLNVSGLGMNSCLETLKHLKR